MAFFEMLRSVAGTKLQAHYFMRQVQVLHYLPGRIRLFLPQMQHSTDVAGEIGQRLQEIPEITEYQINIETGSLLVKYQPKALVNNPLLLEMERIAKKQAGGMRI